MPNREPLPAADDNVVAEYNTVHVQLQPLHIGSPTCPEVVDAAQGLNQRTPCHSQGTAWESTIQGSAGAIQTRSNPTCHEAVHVEQGHDHQGLVLGRQLIGGNDVAQAGCQVALVQRHTLRATGCSRQPAEPPSTKRDRHVPLPEQRLRTSFLSPSER